MRFIVYSSFVKACPQLILLLMDYRYKAWMHHAARDML